MIRAALTILILLAASFANAQLHIPLSGGGAAAPTCTVAQLAARTGPCSSLTPRGGEVAIVTDAEGQSCTATGGGPDRRIPCAYNEPLAAWLPIWGFINPATGDLDMATTRALNNLASLDFAPNLCVGLTAGRLTADANGLVSCVEDIQSGAATSISSAGLRSAMDATYEVIDVDPAEGGSTSAGLQEALARCPGGTPGNCILQLRPNTAYTLPARSTWTGGDASCAFETNGGDNITLQGAAGASISLTDDTQAYGVNLICVEGGSTNIAILGTTLTYNETCSDANCVATGTNGKSIIRIYGNAAIDHVVIEGNVVTATEAVTSGAQASIYALHAYSFTGTPDIIPRDVQIRGNRITYSTRGVQYVGCDSCSVVDNVFSADGVPDEAGTTSNGAIAIYEGRGNRVIGNSVDMSRDGDTTVAGGYGIILHQDFTFSSAVNNNRGAVVSGNSVTGLRVYQMVGIGLIGYQNAAITGNTIMAGVCSASALRSCVVDEDCEDLGGTCDPSPARGINLDASSYTNGSRNTDNLISGNSFAGFLGGGSYYCPIHIYASSATPPDESNTRNTITGNLFDHSVNTENGICGDAGRIALNFVGGNFVAGADKACLAGTDRTTCQLTYTPSTEEVSAQELLALERMGIPHSNTVPGSCLLNGEMYHDDDAPDGQGLYACKNGTYILQAGSGDISSVGSCASGACFQSVAQRLFLASPTGSTGQVTARAIDDVDLPATVCRSNGDNCPAASGAAANTEPFVTTAASGGLSNESVLTEGAMIDITSGATIAVDTTEASTGFTVGNDGGATVTVTLDPAGATTTTLAGGSGGLALTTNGNMGLTFGSPSNTFTLSGSTGDARTVLPTDSIGAAELAADSVGSAEIQADAVGSVELAWDAVDVTTNPLITVNIDATGVEPEDGSGYWIEGGSGASDAGMIWDATNNELDLIVPTGGRVSLPDPGDGSRTIIALDNTSEPTAPAASSTILYALGGEWYKKDNGDSTNERLLLNSGNVSGDLTCTSGGVCTLSSARRTRVCDFNIEAPVAGDDGVFQCYIPAAATLVRVYCNATTGTSVVQLYERTEGAPSTGTAEMLTGDLTCDTDGASTTSFADSALAADALLALGLQTTYTTGTVRVHVEYTEN